MYVRFFHLQLDPSTFLERLFRIEARDFINLLDRNNFLIPRFSKETLKKRWKQCNEERERLFLAEVRVTLFSNFPFIRGPPFSFDLPLRYNGQEIYTVR